MSMPSIRSKNRDMAGRRGKGFGSKRPSSAPNAVPRNKKRALPGGAAGESARAHLVEEEMPSRQVFEIQEEDEDIQDEPSSAYNALLQSLQADGGSFAKAYARRQREEQGASSSEEEGDDADFGHETEDVGLEEEAQEDDMAGQELHLKSRRDKEQGPSKTTQLNLKHEEDDSSGDEQDDHQAADERISSGHDAASNADPFKFHLDHILTEDEITKLQGKQAFIEECSAAGLHGGKWITTSPRPTISVNRGLAESGVKQRLAKHWQELHNDPQWGDFASEQQCQFFSLCRSYRDIYHSRRSGYPAEKEDLSIMDAYLLHVLSHVLQTKDVVTKNNDKLQSQAADAQTVEAPRDHGFTRPKVLFLLPLRSTALKVVSRLLELAPPSQKSSIEHKQRFFDDFGAEELDLEGMDEHQKQVKAKPADFRALFSANNDDHFRIGLKFTRKSIKLYSDFYSSDIVVASPIGLVTKIGEAESEKGKDIDFLSSIEILVVDFIDVILMQNWSHVVSIFDHVNKIPSQQHGVDLMRVREWYLNGHAQHYRQTILLSPFADAGVNALFHRSCVNHAGKVKLRSTFSGVLSKVLLQVRQVYERINCSSITEVDSARFEFFVKQVFPRIKDPLQGGVMLFVRSYFDFVRLRNFLKSQEASFCLLGEYTKQSDISRARAWFFHRKRKIMLYTERAHFYHRFQIRGIHELVFYSLPDNERFYFEMLNMLEGVESPSCTVLFSRFDNLQLERIVGTSRSQKMLASKNQMFMFC